MSLSNPMLYMQVQRGKNQSNPKNLRFPRLKQPNSSSYFWLNKRIITESITDALVVLDVVEVILALGLVSIFLLICNHKTYKVSFSSNELYDITGLGSKTLKKAITAAIELGWITKIGQGYRLSVGSKWIVQKRQANYNKELFYRFQRIDQHKELLVLAKTSSTTPPRSHGKRQDDRSRQRLKINYRHLLVTGLKLEFICGSNQLMQALSRDIKIGVALIAKDNFVWLRSHLKAKSTNNIDNYQVVEVFVHLQQLHPDLIGLKKTKSILKLIKKAIVCGQSVESIKIELNRVSLPRKITNTYGFVSYLLKPLIRNRFSPPVPTISPPVDKQMALAGLGLARAALNKTL